MRIKLSELKSGKQVNLKENERIYILWTSPNIAGSDPVLFTEDKNYCMSCYEDGAFSSIEEALEFIDEVAQSELDDLYERFEGETAYWRFPPSGGECPPPDFTKYGYKTVPGNSNYWHIVPIKPEK